MKDEVEKQYVLASLHDFAPIVRNEAIFNWKKRENDYRKVEKVAAPQSGVVKQKSKSTASVSKGKKGPKPVPANKGAANAAAVVENRVSKRAKADPATFELAVRSMG